MKKRISESYKIWKELSRAKIGKTRLEILKILKTFHAVKNLVAFEIP